ncbi:hypothetical protein H5U98_26475 [Mycolicibacterium boenickei]|uniref:Uncharacterized protein n=1 Tax=Mycolicibacterium boenickei TaxID=146017 RepID=A0AAX2ZV14_9MYCO|nr:hypothetical protein [Mycolicibacterium boenickei]PEG61144.1 hypothetical protein CQY21_08315 [Mycolicibacterium boenickei]UNB98996.1 hypothetical protein H5U98_26475 [Mycolicibacterium boenickei]BBX88581.1 hypothetical protein MBOE_02300 [Mycolicibacterium boenickei]
MPASSASRRATISFGFWLAGAVLLIVGGMIAASASWPSAQSTLFRCVGVLTALAGVGLAYLAGRSRSGDARYLRAAIALSMAIVVVVALIAAFSLAPVHILTLLALLLVIVGSGVSTVSLRRGDDGE